MFGSEEQKREWLPKRRERPHLGVPADRARRRLGPGARGDDRGASRGGGGYRINGTKLWATNGAIADVVVVMARAASEDGRDHARSSARTTLEGVTVTHRNQFMGLRGIENSVTTFETSSCRRRT